LSCSFTCCTSGWSWGRILCRSLRCASSWCGLGSLVMFIYYVVL